MSPILQYCLPALGICRTFPRRLVFSMLDYMSLNIPHLFTIQEIARIKDIIFHTFNETLTGNLYRTSLEIYFFELGCSTRFKWEDSRIIEILTTSALVKATQVFLTQHKIALIHNIQLTLLRESDRFIIEELITRQIPLTDLIALNHCRMYLKVILLSDIVTGDGMMVTDNAWNIIPNSLSHKHLSWPSYGKPPPSY
jgi:hypothetical protein